MGNIRIDPYPNNPEIIELPYYVDSNDYLNRCLNSGVFYVMDAVALAWNEGYLAGKAGVIPKHPEDG